MADITVYVAVVTGVFAVIGATIPQASAVIQNGRQAKREQHGRYELAKREACVALLRSVHELRTQVANNHDYRGNQTAERLALVRQYASATDVAALNVALLAPQPLADLARQLAAAAERQAVEAENTTRPPDFTVLDQCVAAFTTEAVKTSQS